MSASLPCLSPALLCWSLGPSKLAAATKHPRACSIPLGRKEKPKMLCCQEVRAAADHRTWLLSPQPFWKPGPEPEAEDTTPEPLASLAMENMSQETVFRKYCLGIWEALQLVKQNAGGEIKPTTPTALQKCPTDSLVSHCSNFYVYHAH